MTFLITRNEFRSYNRNQVMATDETVFRLHDVKHFY